MEVRHGLKVERKIEAKMVEQTVVKNTVRLSANDIKDIIKGYISSLGYSASIVVFDIGSKYTEDDWGMNGHTSHFLEGATVEVDEPKIEV